MIAPAKPIRRRRSSPRPLAGEGLGVRPADSQPTSRAPPPPLLATITLLVLRDFTLPPLTVATTLDGPGSAFWNTVAARDRQCADDVRAYLYSLRDRRAPDPHLIEAWERFFRLHDPLVRRVVKEHRITASQQDDYIQEAWFAVVRALERSVYNPFRGRLFCWIDKIARNRVIDFLRAASQQQIATHPDLERITCHRELDPASSYERQEERELVRHVLVHLEGEVSHANYQILHLRWIEGKSFLQISAELTLTAAETHYRHYRVKKRLCTLFQSHMETDA